MDCWFSMIAGGNKKMIGTYKNMDTKLFDSLSLGSFESRLFAYMKVVGLDKITVHYSGGGDSGGMDYMSFQPSTKNDDLENSIKENLEEPLTSPIYSRHGSFADGGGYNVDGEVIWDAKNGRVSIEGTDHYYECSDDEDSEETKEERDEGFDETLYDSSDDKGRGGEREYELVFMFAKDYFKKKLPEEFHNRLLIEATNGDEYATQYVKEFK